ncbi:hypothetical protein CSAL01_02596 [Colletotrichum salicis]|uniref:Uncharacterized protein n=1 Tax=Colletotrichum salicis TaxID=1209931 RepID=A0A135V416_9PEZI|nr:hypothetical protein CSAL01_02596 [Colletotrichum salicis]
MGVFSLDGLPPETLHDILKVKTNPPRLVIHETKPTNTTYLASKKARPLQAAPCKPHTYAAFGLPHILKLISSELRRSPKKAIEPSSYLHRLTKCCLHEMLGSLLKLNVPPDELDAQGEAALHIAARRGCGRGCIRTLLAESANPDVESRLGWTPLMIATKYGHLEAITELIRGGARLDRRGFHGWTALHIAAHNGREEALELLVGAGASLGIVDNDGLKANDAPVGRVNSHFPCRRLGCLGKHRPLVSLGIPPP